MSENRPIIIALVVVGLAIVGFIIYSVTSTEPEPQVVSQPIAIPEPEPVVVEAEPETEIELETVVVEPVEILEEAGPAFVLPLLDDSDQLIRDGVVSLTRHEGVNVWLSPNELIRKFVAFVDGVANGQVVKEPVRILTPEGPFLVRQISDEVYLLDNVSYKRYDFFTAVVVSLDARRAAEFFLLVKPMLQEAYDELGYPNKKFDDVVFRAIGRLLETPVINEPIRLVRPVVMYRFEDKKLESLSAAQKQLIRMGPRNTRTLQVKLSEIALELRSLLENR
ncbi:MAG: DUF3014 domain-containing protein [Gammaproteobacteria bacterium]|nr:DUF3014 domain-containing protein [Gammaproteobacteria bacterium]